MKLLLFSIVFLLISCSKEDKPVVNNPVPGPVIVVPDQPVPENPIPLPPNPDENNNQEKPAGVNADGLKVGQCKLIGDKNLYAPDAFVNNKYPECPKGAAVNNECNPANAQACKLPDGSGLVCQNVKSHKCFAWLYEKENGKLKPLNVEAKAYVWSFALCMAGMCNPRSQVVMSDKKGYVELISPTLTDSFKIELPEGYFVHCKDNKPLVGIHNGTGNSIHNGQKEPLLGPYIFYKLKNDSCSLGSP